MFLKKRVESGWGGPKRNPSLRRPQFWKVHMSGLREEGVVAAAGPHGDLWPSGAEGKERECSFCRHAEVRPFPKQPLTGDWQPGPG